MNQIESLSSKDHGATLLLSHARRASREDDDAFAESVAKCIMDEATARHDYSTRWLAAGDLGQILERSGRLDEALSVWTECFEEASNNLITANRPSLSLERAKCHNGASRVCREALEREPPANIEEQLRMQLDDVETKLNPTKERKGRCLGSHQGHHTVAYARSSERSSR